MNHIQKTIILMRIPFYYVPINSDTLSINVKLIDIKT